jgi:hypothetical protein
VKRLLVLGVLAAAVFVGYAQFPPTSDVAAPAAQSDKVLADAFDARKSDFWIEGQGVVTKILPDDHEGNRHQRFIVRLGSGQTLLVSHNIDIAPRLSTLKEGDSVEFKGEYDWSAKGGVVHWTHRDPAGQRPGGWLKHNGRTYR